MRWLPGRPARRPGRRARRGWLTATALAALVLAASVVWQAGHAAFTWTSAPTSTSLQTGTVAVSDDDAGSAAFSVSGLRPGASATRCIAVTSTGSAPSAVRLYATGRSTNALASALRLTVVVGTGGGTPGCGGFRPSATVYTGTLAAFPANGFGSGVGEWISVGGPDTRTYQVTYSLPANASTGAQNGTATVGLTWEARST